MKIAVDDGSISFAAGVIQRGQDRRAFFGTRIGATAQQTLVNEDWINLSVKPEPDIAGTVIFKGDRLVRVLLLMAIPSDDSNQWTEKLELERKMKHDTWLRAELGQPPYEYAWGSVTSDFDPRGCVSEIIIAYAE